MPSGERASEAFQDQRRTDRPSTEGLSLPPLEAGLKERLLTVGEAAVQLNVTERWIRRAIFDGRISIVKLGALVRIPQSALDELVAIGTRPATLTRGWPQEPTGRTGDAGH
ncbi:MAG: excisionase family DNA-binding protein [Actinomycetota bacterium]